MATKGKHKLVAVAGGSTVAEPVTGPVEVLTKTAEQRATERWEAAKEARKAGTLKGTLIEAVKAHAAKHAKDGTGWDTVLAMTDDDIWAVTQWCDFERGAVGMMARHLKRVASGGPV